MSDHSDGMNARSRLATASGLLAFLAGIVLFALAVPTRRGVGYELVFGAAVPAWAFALSLVVGPLLIAGGAAFGMRYGHFERYHEDYDPETGTIDSDHPFARFHEYVSKTDPAESPGPHPEKFVFSRTHLAVLTVVLTWGPLAYVLVSLPTVSSLLRWMMVAVLGGGGLVTFAVIDYVLRRSDETDYDPTW